MSENVTRLEPGKRYRVTTVVEGVADNANEIALPETGAYWSNRVGQTLVYGPAVSIELVELEPVPGCIYRDADHELFLRLPNDRWLDLNAETNFAGHEWSDDYPTRPIVELELKETPA